VKKAPLQRETHDATVAIKNGRAVSSAWLSFGIAMSFGLAACGGSVATPAPSPTSTQSGWQVILTVNTSQTCFDPLGNCGFGIAGIVLDGKGNLYLTEFDDDLIYKYTTSGKLVTKWGGTGHGPGQLTKPEKLALDAQGNLYVTEIGSRISWDGSLAENVRIQKFSPTGTPLAQWGTLGSGPGQFNVPMGIAIDQQGNIFVADAGNHRIQKLSSRGEPLIQWHTVGNGVGERTETGFDLALDASGNLYVSEPHPMGPGPERIEKFSSAGEPLAHWGESGSGPGQFNKPFCLTLDRNGNVFVVDSGNNRIQEFSPDGKYLAQWKGPKKGLHRHQQAGAGRSGEHLHVCREPSPEARGEVGLSQLCP
jgi:DNA-binding beta-propeller fold protein YncE